MKIKIGMVQIGTSFGNQDFLPYSIGLFQAYIQKYLENIDDFEFLLPVHRKYPVKDIVERYKDAGIVFFSVYTWNFNLSCEIAKQLKIVNPNIVTVFGGPHIPMRDAKGILLRHPYIDLACLGNGEETTKRILEKFHSRDWGNIPGVNYRNKDEFVLSPESPRILDINSIPSPYLSGAFDKLIDTYKETKWVISWETNRGCPFSCTYCDWGSATNNKVCTFDLERLFAEIDWFSEHKIEFVTCCDSNFGMLERDYEIIKRFAENKVRYGYPENISVQSTKNLKEHSFNTYKLLSDMRLKSGISISLQSLNPDTLKAIQRTNLKPEFFHEAQKKLSSANVPTFTDLIMSLPCETYESFIKGISTVIENGQHTKIIFNDLSILPNTEMGDPEYQKKYKFDIVESKVVGRHESLSSDNEIYETQRIVVANDALSREDWIRIKVYSWFVSLLYFAKILQIPIIILMKEYGIKFHEIMERFINSDTPILGRMRKLFENKALDMQNGGSDFIPSKEWLNLWWPADEFAFIQICAEHDLGEFYLEAETLIYDLLFEHGYREMSAFSYVIRSAMILNQALVKLPFKEHDFSVTIDYNIWEVYTAFLKGIDIPLEKIPSKKYLVKSSNTCWDSWEKWAEKVVWQEYKKGSYIYRCEKV
jgi:radical SAM superfamily enzyme YgiQ (UPF0313 family)